jgi:ribosomal protein S18 acetylase RimI-like enzyme
MTAIRIHIATEAELEPVAVLFDAYRQFYGQAGDLHLARRFIADRLRRDESVILLANSEAHKSVGFCQLYPTFCSVAAAPIYVLYDLFVVPEARQCGIGKALMQAAEHHAANKGMARMELMTAKSNRPAQSLYQSLGWTRDEAFYAYSKPIAR